MKKINILKKNEDFSRIISQTKPYKYKDYIIYKEKTDNEISHFGISVGKKVGKAVTRNRIKRQIKSIIDKYPYKNNINCIIIIRRGIIDKKFSEIEEDLKEVLSRVHI